VQSELRTASILILVLLATPAVAGANLALDGELSFSRAKITLVNGKHYFARHVTMEGDSISFSRIRLETVGYQPAPVSERDHRSFSLDSVSDIAIPDGNHSALGAGIGALAGFAIWGLATSGAGLSSWEGTLFAVPLLIMPGAGIGALIGSGVEDWEPVYSRDQVSPADE